VPEAHAAILFHRLMDEPREADIDEGSQGTVDTQYRHAQRGHGPTATPDAPWLDENSTEANFAEPT
jgi:hypothetical protein